MITEIFFSNNSALKSHDNSSGEAQYSFQQTINSPEINLLIEFNLIEESDNPQDSLRHFLDRNPQSLDNQLYVFRKLFFYAIEKNNIEAIKIILDKNQIFLIIKILHMEVQFFMQLKMQGSKACNIF